MDTRVQVVHIKKGEKKTFYHSKIWRTPYSNSGDPGVPDPLLKTPAILYSSGSQKCQGLPVQTSLQCCASMLLARS